MPDEYWLILKGPRFRISQWPKKTVYLNKYCDYDEVVQFVNSVKGKYPNWTINIGITRGNDIYILA